MFIGTSLEVVGTTMSVQGLEPGPKGTICIPEKSRPTHLMIFAWVYYVFHSVFENSFHETPTAPDAR